MKKITIFAVLLFLSGCVRLSERDDVRAGIESAGPVIVLTESYKSENGKYPTSIGDLALSESLVADLNRHDIQYKTYNENSEYSVAFGVSGFITTPWCGYGSFRNEWQCLQK